MSSQADDGQQGVARGLVFAVVAVVVSAVLGATIYQRSHGGAASKAADQAVAAAPVAPEPAAAAAQAASDAASIKVENGVVKFYFASGKADLAAGAKEALADVIQGAQAGRKLVISGFHDITGSAVKNAELAKLRAFALRDALKAAGIAEEKIEIKKPGALMLSGSNAEARRVEVALQ